MNRKKKKKKKRSENYCYEAIASKPLQSDIVQLFAIRILKEFKQFSFFLVSFRKFPCNKYNNNCFFRSEPRLQYCLWSLHRPRKVGDYSDLRQ